MADIKKSPQHVAKLGKHTYQMEQRFCTTTPVGVLTPVYHDILNPGEHVKIKSNVFTFTDAFNKYALNRFTEHVDYFFVPYELLWSLWPSFRTNVADIKSSAFAGNDAQNFDRTFPYISGSVLIETLNRQLQEDGELYADIVTPSTSTWDLQYNYSTFKEMVRLIENVGISPYEFAKAASDADGMNTNKYQNLKSMKFNPHFFCAYQAIYQHWYRLTDYEKLNVLCYSLDNNSLSGADQSRQITFEQLREILTPRYRPWKKDLFTNIKPQPLFNPTSLNFFGSPDFKFDVTLPKSDSFSHVDIPGGSNVYIDSNYTMDLRQSFMFEKYLQITQHAKKSYDAQILAHFGYKVPTDVKHDVHYIGSHTQRISVQGVEATAAGVNGESTSLLGELGSRAVGIGAKNETLEFTAPCDGILMGIYSIVPESDYEIRGIDKTNLYSDWTDWYNPEFDKQGMVPVFKYEGIIHDDNFNAQRVAWRYPYTELKQKSDMVGGAFIRSRKSYVAQRTAFEFHDAEGTGQVDVTSPILHISPNYTDPITLLKYQQAPTVFGWDSRVENSAFPQDVYFETDAFMHSIEFNVEKRSTMSPYGLFDL